MNIYTIILYLLVIVIICFRIRNGFKKGFVKELADTISLVIAVLVGRMLVSSYHAFVSERLGEAISGVLLIGLIFAFYRLLKILIATLKLFSHLPVIKGVDKFLGIFAGAFEGYFIVLLFIKIIKEWIII